MKGNEAITFGSFAWRFLYKFGRPGVLATFRTIMTLDRNRRLSIGRVLEEQARAYPDRIALRDRDTQWSWSEFNARANRYAAVLAGEGVGRGDVVALNIRNSPAALAVLCGCAKLGAVTAMINTSQTGEVLAHSLKLVKAKLLVAGEGQIEIHNALPADGGAPQPGRRLVIRETPDGELPREYADLDALARDAADTNPASTSSIGLHEPCYYIFTSGTTGMPKASVMSHFRWYKSSLTARLALDLVADDVFYCCLPFYHSNALTLAMGSVMVSGATLAIGEKFSASRFWDELRNFDATVFCYIGEILRYLLNQAPAASDRQHRVRAILGNGLRPDIWDAFKSRFTIPRIHEFYAASEGTNGFFNVFNFDKTCGFSPNGWALVAYDVDADEPVRGRHGRLCKVGRGGVGLLLTEVSERMPFDGYTRESDTEKKLLRDVFKPGDVWFNTGDLMRSQGFGHVQFVDRVGDTFRWQGENVATTQVEAVAAQWPQVEEAVVYGVELPGRDGRCGMLSCTLRDGHTLDADGFAAHLRKALPKYAVPRFLRLRAEQELTGTFKHTKALLKKDGYDLASVEDPIWFLGAEDAAWRPLTSQLKRAIDTGEVRV